MSTAQCPVSSVAVVIAFFSDSFITIYIQWFIYNSIRTSTPLLSATSGFVTEFRDSA